MTKPEEAAADHARLAAELEKIGIDKEKIETMMLVASAGSEGFELPRKLDIHQVRLWHISRIHPGLLTGFSKEEDPSGTRVKCTELALAILAALSTDA